MTTTPSCLDYERHEGKDPIFFNSVFLAAHKMSGPYILGSKVVFFFFTLECKNEEDTR